ncbi:MAG: response regulator [Magnetococcales bacterium]|nr:response regulator [Magnetococcales bacterium]
MARKQILIVEDSAIQRVMLQRLLTEAGYQVEAARDGVEGLNQARSSHPDLVISDINMPNMDGYEMCQAMRQDTDLAATPVMILTSLDDPREVLRGITAGADNYVTKPYDSDNLLDRIARLLEEASTPPEDDDDDPTIMLGNERHVISAGRRQILTLLLSTYENAVQRNQELLQTQLELKVLNEQLEEKVAERTQQLEAANRAKLMFINNMSHELRTPLNAIIGLTDLTMGSEDLTDDHKSHLSIVHQSAESLLLLINSLLDFAKLETHELTTRKTVFHLRKHLEKALAPEMEKAVAKGLFFLCRISQDVPDALIGDASRLASILTQLTSNGVKFTDSGHIIVTIVPIEVLNRSVLIRFSVDDTGCGIPEERKETIFSSFMQGDGTSTRHHGGTGIGLTLAQRLANLLGGNLGFVSVNGMGSTFHLDLRIETDPSVDTRNSHEDAFNEETLLIGGMIGADETMEQTLESEDSTAAISVDTLLARLNNALNALERGAVEVAESETIRLKRSTLPEGTVTDLRTHLFRLVLSLRKRNIEESKQQFITLLTSLQQNTDT